MKKITLSIIALVAFALPAFSQDLTALLDKNENQPRPPATEGQMQMIIQNQAGQQRIREITAYTRIDASGDQYQTLVFTAPADVRNTRFLTIDYENEAQDDEQYIFIPALRRVRTIGTSGGESKTGAFLGSDFTYADLGSLDRSNFNARIIGDDSIDGEDFYIVEFTAKDDEVISNYGYSKVVRWIHKENATSRQSEYYDADGNLIKRLVVYGQHLVDGQYWQFERMEMSNLETGGKTIWAFTQTNILPSIDQRYFTLRFLERGR